MAERDTVIAAVRARLQRVGATKDLAPVLESETVTEARLLRESVAADADDLEAQHLLGWLHWYRYQALPVGEDRDDLQMSAAMFLPCFVAGFAVRAIPPSLLPLLAAQATPLATTRLHESLTATDLDRLSAAVDLGQRILEVGPADYPDRSLLLHNVGSALLVRSRREGSAADLDHAVRALTEAAEAARADDPNRAAYLNTLAVAREAQLSRSASPPEPEADIEACRAAVETCTPDDADRPMHLARLGAALLSRFAQTGDDADLDAALAASQAALETPALGHPLPPKLLTSVMDALTAGFHRDCARSQFSTTMNEVELRRWYLNGWSMWYLSRSAEAGPVHSMHAAIGMFMRCFLSGVGEFPAELLPAVVEEASFAASAGLRHALDSADAAALDLAIDSWCRIVDATPPGHDSRPSHLDNLSTALHTRFERAGAPADLDAAIEVDRAALLGRPADHPDRPRCLNNLGCGLRMRFEQSGAAADLDAAIELSRAAVEAAPGAPMYLTGLGITLRLKFEQTGSRAELDTAVEVSNTAVSLTPIDDPNMPMYLNNAGLALRTRFGRTGNRADLDAAIEARDTAVFLTPAQSPHRATHLNGLGTALLERYELTGTVADLDAAIEHIGTAVNLIPTGSPFRAGMVNNLGGALLSRHRRTGATPDLDAAIAYINTAIDLTPSGEPNRARMLSNLASALRSRYDRTGTPADLDAAIEASRDAADTATENPGARAATLATLSGALRARFEQSGAVADLNSAIETLDTAITLTADDDPQRSTHLLSMSGLLLLRFQRFGTAADVDAAVDAGSVAAATIRAGDTARPRSLNALGSALHARYEQTGAPADLDATIDAFHAAADATALDHADRPRYLANLGTALQSRFRNSGNAADLDAAIESCRAAADTAPIDHPMRADCLATVGGAFLYRFVRTGAEADLDASVDAFHTAVDTTPADHPKRLTHLANLGHVLQFRFERTGSLADLDTAINACRAAIDATHVDSPDRASILCTLGDTLRHRSRRTGAKDDLDAAIDTLRAAVNSVASGHPRRPSFLNSLGISLMSRFEDAGELADLDAAIDTLRAAVDTIAVEHIYHTLYSSNLGGALTHRFNRTGERADLDAAIETLGTAVANTPGDHSNRGRHLSNLAFALHSRFDLTGTQSDRELALSSYAQVVETESAATVSRIRAARHAADLAASSDVGKAADFLEAAVRLLPTVAPRHLERGDQQHAVGGFSGLAADAAALALAAPAGSGGQRAERALRLLEAGRGLLLSQMLDTRNDVADLRRENPDLAARFVDLRSRLDQSTAPDVPGLLTDGADVTADWNLRVGVRREVTDQLAATLAEIRALEGFSSFGLPPAIGELLAQGAEGPVVTVNVSEYRCDAIILTADEVSSLELPGLTPSALIDHIGSFLVALHTTTSSPASYGERVSAQAAIREILAWLWDNVAQPVLAALGHHACPAPETPWPRVWWTTGGLLGLLPLHAAGYHTSSPDPDRRTVMDRVVSSYTPTIRALHYARVRGQSPGDTAPGATGKALIVAMPTTPGLPDRGHLPNVLAETELLRDHLHPHEQLTEPPVPGPDTAELTPTKANVLARLPGCAIAHFACHCANHTYDPSQSRLLLHDHRENPFTVASLAAITLDHAQLAYLSACRTALTSSGELIDEAIHLTSAFQLAGFPHVIGTFWAVNDEVTLTIADAFYTHLRTPAGTLDTSRAAHALHRAIHAVRAEYPTTPSLWAAHLHAGC